LNNLFSLFERVAKRRTEQIVAIFAPTGECWSIGYPGRTFPLKDSKGLGQIYRLLQHQGQECDALDLMSSPGEAILSEAEASRDAVEDSTRGAHIGDSGEMLDGQAKQEYWRRLVELRADLEEARAEP
jgi:hypothetical protein